MRWGACRANDAGRTPTCIEWAEWVSRRYLADRLLWPRGTERLGRGRDECCREQTEHAQHRPAREAARRGCQEAVRQRGGRASPQRETHMFAATERVLADLQSLSPELFCVIA